MSSFAEPHSGKDCKCCFNLIIPSFIAYSMLIKETPSLICCNKGDLKDIEFKLGFTDQFLK